MAFDSGRLADLAVIDKKIADFNTPRRERERLQRVRDAIMREAQDPRIAVERERMINASRHGDGRASEQIARNLMRMTGQQAE